MNLILIIIIVALFSYLGKTAPVWGFWIALSLYFNPSGLISYHFPNPLFGPLLLTDVMSFCIIFCFIMSKGKYHLWDKQDLNYKRFFKYCFFLLVYYYVVNIVIVPSYFHRFDLHNLLKGRTQIWGLLIGIMTYKELCWYGFKYFYKTILWTSIISLSLFILSLGGLDIVPVLTMQRYQGEELQRIGMISYGFLAFILYIGWIIILSNRKYPKDINITLTIIAFLLFIVINLLTLTRRTYLNLVMLPLIISFIFIRLQKRTISIRKMAIIIITIIIPLAIFTPQVLNNSTRIFKDTFLLITTGTDTKGEANYRLKGTGDLLLTKQFIEESPIFGQGYFYFNFDIKLAKNFNTLSHKKQRFINALDASGEVPIYSVFFEKGLVGFCLYIYVYWSLVLITKNNHKLLKKRQNLISHYDPTAYIFSLLGIVFIIQTFTINAYTLFGSFLDPMFMINCSIIFASNTFLKTKSYIK